MDTTVLVAIITAAGTVVVAAIGLVKINSSKQPRPSQPVASRDFLIGRWRVDQTMGIVSGNAVFAANGGSDIIYESEGKFRGAQFVAGHETHRDGRWEFTKLSHDTFRLTVVFDEAGVPPWQGTFQIVDRDRIHNIDQNYDAFRSSV